MRTLLTVNGGSSSLKCGLYQVEPTELKNLCIVKFGNLLGEGVRFSASSLEGKVLDNQTLDFQSFSRNERHQAALDFVLGWFKSEFPDHQLMASGHRIVHGGNRFSHPIKVDAQALEMLDTFVPLAPLHQPYNLMLIRAMQNLLPELPAVGCFDTMFHAHQDPLERLYAIPKHLSDAGVMKYGFHGLSYEYIVRQLRNSNSSRLKTIVCHLGAGASMCAINQEKSVASSMGFTAVEGLPMGSRCGSIDPGVLLYLMREYQMDLDAIEALLYKESGWYGVSGGISSEMLELHKAQHPDAERAIDLFCLRIAEEVGRLTASLGGLEQLVFTGGVGENDADVRARVIERCAWLGVKLNSTANAHQESLISTPESVIQVRVIPTDEEMMIAMHTHDQVHS
ncbi:acetate/propionate family kinase [Nitrincola tibetensis]|uniref:Acetate kinase n=1 Tax=Nitrincola tibetensis TaxID=2219697 RepID=A0A364NL37_9GAMM|nr:acetate/propionate family kinase [Nitrincola tibetensis]RAU17782.1 acetate/propionate family kinase [Nitrincola tibetensis]